MSVNGVTNNDAAQAYGAYQKSNTNTSQKTNDTIDNHKKTNSTGANSSGVVYEPSENTASSSKTQKYKPDAETIARLKNDAENRKAQLVELVHKMMSGQSTANGKATDIWGLLRSGDFTVDAATKSQAQADIAENGYWGVGQTSQRILDFASALTGGDPDKIEEMREAFQKGYKEAEKTWGGKLPDLSQKTYDAVMAGFDKLKGESGAKTENKQPKK